MKSLGLEKSLVYITVNVSYVLSLADVSSLLAVRRLRSPKVEPHHPAESVVPRSSRRHQQPVDRAGRVVAA